MKKLVQLEELAMWVASAYVLYRLQADWWWYLLLLLGPDISMIGYAAGNKTGGIIYNLFHHKAIAVAVMIAGWILGNTTVLCIGLVLFGHSSMDRLFGYGLKLQEGFKFTHLGEIGKK